MSRPAAELLWFRRREVLAAAAAWTGLGGFAAAQTQQRSNIVDLQGAALLNGAAMRQDQTIQTGDTVHTGPGSQLIFVIGNAAFLARQNTQLTVERGAGLSVVSVLRLVTGAVASAWGRGGKRQIVTPTLTAGIRGTGVYAEHEPAHDSRTYLCNCYGTVAIEAGSERMVSRSEYHQSFWADPQAKDGRVLTPAGAINHSDEEMEFVARLAGERTAWEVAGRKGVHDGHGYMEPGRPHPLQP